MARLELRPDEPMKLVELAEQLFAMSLAPVKKALDGLTFSGAVTVSKPLKDGALTVEVDFTK